MNIFQIATDTIYINILRFILKIWWKPIVSYSSNAIVIQFCIRTSWSTLSRHFWSSKIIPPAKFPLSSWSLYLSVKWISVDCQILAFGWQAVDFPSIPSFSRIFLKFIKYKYSLDISWGSSYIKPFGDDLIPFHMWWKEIMLKVRRSTNILSATVEGNSFHWLVLNDKFRTI